MNLSLNKQQILVQQATLSKTEPVASNAAGRVLLAGLVGLSALLLTAIPPAEEETEPTPVAYDFYRKTTRVINGVTWTIQAISRLYTSDFTASEEEKNNATTEMQIEMTSDTGISHQMDLVVVDKHVRLSSWKDPSQNTIVNSDHIFFALASWLYNTSHKSTFVDKELWPSGVAYDYKTSAWLYEEVYKRLPPTLKTSLGEKFDYIQNYYCSGPENEDFSGV